ncbi:Fibrinogen C domain-containing protein 1-A [Holothuria leucospilota]|uniref:Fibrinogen C domain-containing protein 1-A n=2 Tax=Deuterostomia TaxID=33511 RepID=A0A9Q1BU43_HOLLE|nr:Fibrinogen C domain-containing protein 1-A [Holothuria leucospilota]
MALLLGRLIARDLKKFLFVIIVNGVFAQTNGSEHNNHITTGADSVSAYFYYQRLKYPRDCTEVQNNCSTIDATGVYLIQPVGYREPFEVFCYNELNDGGWMVIQRRFDNSLDFNRTWKEYKYGFGFHHRDMWLGNEKISYLTNQAKYELRVDIGLSSGSSFYVKYDSFRISDEWSQYALASVGTYDGNVGLQVKYCPENMIYGTSTCQVTCADPDGRNCEETHNENDTCICADGFLMKSGTCVDPSQCGCFVMEGIVVPEGGFYVSEDCSEKYTCNNDQLTSNTNYACNANATCAVREGVRQCYCNEKYKGDGETCSIVYKDCYDAYLAGQTQDGVYTILPREWSGSPFNVSCVMASYGGGWTVFQRRNGGSTNFYRDWESYKNGFGSSGGDFWLGNEKLHFITQQADYTLRVDIVTQNNLPKYAEYASFRINGYVTNYQVDSVGSYSGNAGNGMISTTGRSFSTFDRDNDGCGRYNCAQQHNGGWWYGVQAWCETCWPNYCPNFLVGNCRTACSHGNPNGAYNVTSGKSLFWYHYFHDSQCNLNFIEMKLRPS